MEENAATTVISELEGALFNDPDPFSYFMLVAFEASGIFRFAVLLLLWPVIRVLELSGKRDAGLRLMTFVAVAGLREREIESVARAVLPKFFMDDLNVDSWRVFGSSGCKGRVVVTRMPRIMVERFAKDHLMADEVIGSELKVNLLCYATGFIKGEIGSSDQVTRLLDKDGNRVLRVVSPSSESFMPQHEGKMNLLTFSRSGSHPRDQMQLAPNPVIFHDGRLVKRPTPSIALLILLWLPLGIVLAVIRIIIGLIIPLSAVPYVSQIFGGNIIVHGKPPQPTANGRTGVLFVCTHRTLMDPVVLSTVLGRRIPALTYSISRLSEILSPIPTVRLTRVRQQDADKIKQELEKGDLIVCPEGTTCREPFLLRFSPLFAELTDRIVPVAMNYRVGFFHATTARGWKGLDPIFFFMNPRPVYEVTFLNQLPAEATCSAGKSPYDVANYVQRILAATLGFECTNFTRKDKYRVLAGNDGTVSRTPLMARIKKVVGTLRP
ncbi:hypothetical protein MLD38_003662 [Melastoma candidum]|uniref:Uncharacterized protein n=1 Tax=Melastoma candidum TaxID=119954 RepID=A0ACB9S2S6_9MYRT|nr:hypothetical protein MLD38_003662 [Melastoma candidum]